MISLNSGTAPSFDDPLEMLHACHGKILQQCTTLQKLAHHMVEHGCDEAAQQAATGILRYFDTAGRFHHQDEELDLFPALRASAGQYKSLIEGLLEKLLSEHVEMMSVWDELRLPLMELASGKNYPIPKGLMHRFITIHTAHIDIEESELLPLAAKILDSSQLGELGTRMAKRRRIAWSEIAGLHTL